MPNALHLFQYRAYDDTYQLHQGTHWARNRATVKSWLYYQGLRCRQCKRVYPWYHRVSLADRRDTGQQLANLMCTGVPLSEALALLASNDTGMMGAALAEISNQVASGQYLSTALRAHPTLFDSLFCNLVSVGERSGTLDLMLERAAQYQEKSLTLHRNLQSALAYPCFVLLVAAALVLFLLLGVIPQFETLFANFQTPLPPLTRGLLAFSRFIGAHGGGIFVLCASTMLLAIKAYQKISRVQWYTMYYLYRIPIWGDFFKKVLFARLTYTLALTLKAGVPMLEALHIVASVITSPIYQKALQSTITAVSAGTPLHVALRQTGVFPKILIQWVATGETSGSLDTLLFKVAQHYEDALTVTTQTLHRLLEPIIMVILGGIVGTLVIAMYWPIFKMGTVF